MLERQLFDGLVIDLLGLRVDGVMDGVEQLARTVYRRAVRKMPAVQKIQAHHRIARARQRRIDGVIGRSARKRLHVYKQAVGWVGWGSEYFGAAPPRQSLDHVGIFDAFIVARVGIAAVVGKLFR